MKDENPEGEYYFYTPVSERLPDKGDRLLVNMIFSIIVKEFLQSEEEKEREYC